uniref:hypothetical protein n=2 Tax=Gelidibacter sp. TaxID=2018083 RepID=UPI00404B01CD
MDELDLLKKDWHKEDTKYPKLSYDQIYTMILKRSSSIVKWIFIISILEFVFWIGISFLMKDSESAKRIDELHANYILIPLSIAGYLVLGYFFYLFFKNYKNISVTDNAKTLMENILKTRRTVRHYVAFNLIYLVIATFVILGIEFNQNELFIASANNAAADGDVFLYYARIVLVVIAMLGIIIAILLFFYWLIYGVLLRKLNRNYKELKKLEL